MKSLNQKERNSAILRFSLWLFICVIIICVPVIISLFVTNEQRGIQAGENEALIEEINFEREFFAVEIQKILDLMKKRETNEINGESFNAELMNVVTEIKEKTTGVLEWRGDMYRNIVNIAEYLITANKIMSYSADNREKQLSELNKVILEFESCGETIADLNDEKKKKDLQQGLNDVESQFKRALKMLNNLKSGLD
jgi:hypothetical protein